MTISTMPPLDSTDIERINKGFIFPSAAFRAKPKQARLFRFVERPPRVRSLRERFDLVPDALSGVCSSSPLLVRELSEFTDIPVFNSAEPDIELLAGILLGRKNSRCKMDDNGQRTGQ